MRVLGHHPICVSERGNTRADCNKLFLMLTNVVPNQGQCNRDARSTNQVVKPTTLLRLESTTLPSRRFRLFWDYDADFPRLGDNQHPPRYLEGPYDVPEYIILANIVRDRFFAGDSAIYQCSTDVRVRLNLRKSWRWRFDARSICYPDIVAHTLVRDLCLESELGTKMVAYVMDNMRYYNPLYFFSRTNPHIPPRSNVSHSYSVSALPKRTPVKPRVRSGMESGLRLTPYDVSYLKSLGVSVPSVIPKICLLAEFDAQFSYTGAHGIFPTTPKLHYYLYDHMCAKLVEQDECGFDFLRVGEVQYCKLPLVDNVLQDLPDAAHFTAVMYSCYCSRDRPVVMGTLLYTYFMSAFDTDVATFVRDVVCNMTIHTAAIDTLLTIAEFVASKGVSDFLDSIIALFDQTGQFSPKQPVPVQLKNLLSSIAFAFIGVTSFMRVGAVIFDATYHKMFVEYKELVAIKDDTAAKVNNSSLHSLLQKFTAFGTKIDTHVLTQGPSLTVIVRGAYLVLRDQVRLRCSEVSMWFTSTERNKPFGIILAGAAGTGKTTIINPLLKWIYGLLDGDANNELLYGNFAPDANGRAETAMPHHAVLYAGDLGNQITQTAKDSPWPRIQDLLDTTPYANICADLSKKNDFLAPCVVGVTTNAFGLPHMANSLIKVVFNVEAIYRRFEVILRVEKRPGSTFDDNQFKKSFAAAFTSQEAADYVDSCCVFSVCHYSTDDAGKRIWVINPVKVQELFAHIRACVDKHRGRRPVGTKPFYCSQCQCLHPVGAMCGEVTHTSWHETADRVYSNSIIVGMLCLLAWFVNYVLDYFQAAKTMFQIYRDLFISTLVCTLFFAQPIVLSMAIGAYCIDSIAPRVLRSKVAKRAIMNFASGTSIDVITHYYASLDAELKLLVKLLTLCGAAYSVDRLIRALPYVLRPPGYRIDQIHQSMNQDRGVLPYAIPKQSEYTSTIPSLPLSTGEPKWAPKERGCYSQIFVDKTVLTQTMNALGDHLLPHVVTMYNREVQSTGTFIGAYLLTARHCVSFVDKGVLLSFEYGKGVAPGVHNQLLDKSSVICFPRVDVALVLVSQANNVGNLLAHFGVAYAHGVEFVGVSHISGKTREDKPGVFVRDPVIISAPEATLTIEWCTNNNGDSEFRGIVRGHEFHQGDSGGPVYVSRHPNGATESFIIGVVSGYANCQNRDGTISKCGIVALVTRKMIEDAMGQFGAMGREPVFIETVQPTMLTLAPVSPKNVLCNLAIPGSPIGTIIGVAASVYKNKLTMNTSLMTYFEELVDGVDVGVPRRCSRGVGEDGIFHSTINDGLRPAQNPRVPQPVRYYAGAAKWAMNHMFLPIPPELFDNTWTYYCGTIDGVLQSVDVTTSAGPFAPKKKADYFAPVESGVRTLLPFAQAELARLESLLDQGKGAFFSKLFEKDEEVGKPGKAVRLVNAVDMYSYLLMRKYFAPVIYMIRRSSWVGCQVGYNAMSQEATSKLVASIASRKFAYDTDFSAYDKRHFSTFLLYLLYSFADRIQGVYAKRLKVVAELLYACVFIYGPDVFMMSSTWISGTAGTTELNSMVVSAMMRWALVGQDTSAQLASYGDDLVVSTDCNLDFPLLCDVLSNFNHVLTSGATKTQEFVLNTTVTDVTFLQRSFVSRDGQWYAPLSMRSICKSLVYTKWSANPLEQLEGILSNVLMECFLHGPEVYAKAVLGVNRQTYVKVVPKKYEQLLEEYVSGGSLTWKWK